MPFSKLPPAPFCRLYLTSSSGVCLSPQAPLQKSYTCKKDKKDHHKPRHRRSSADASRRRGAAPGGADAAQPLPTAPPQAAHGHARRTEAPPQVALTQRTAEAPPQAALTQRTAEHAAEVPPQAAPTRCATPYSRIWRPLAAALACGSWAFTGGLACHGGPHVGPHTLTPCWRKPYRGCRGRRSSRGQERLAQGQRGRGSTCPHPTKGGDPAPWVRPTTPPAAPSGHRGRPTWGATASPHAQGPRSLANWYAM